MKTDEGVVHFTLLWIFFLLMALISGMQSIVNYSIISESGSFIHRVSLISQLCYSVWCWFTGVKCTGKKDFVYFWKSYIFNFRYKGQIDTESVHCMTSMHSWRHWQQFFTLLCFQHFGTLHKSNIDSDASLLSSGDSPWKTEHTHLLFISCESVKCPKLQGRWRSSNSVS